SVPSRRLLRSYLRLPSPRPSTAFPVLAPYPHPGTSSMGIPATSHKSNRLCRDPSDFARFKAGTHAAFGQSSTVRLFSPSESRSPCLHMEPCVTREGSPRSRTPCLAEPRTARSSSRLLSVRAPGEVCSHEWSPELSERDRRLAVHMRSPRSEFQLPRYAA